MEQMSARVGRDNVMVLGGDDGCPVWEELYSEYKQGLMDQQDYEEFEQGQLEEEQVRGGVMVALPRPAIVEELLALPSRVKTEEELEQEVKCSRMPEEFWGRDHIGDY